VCEAVQYAHQNLVVHRDIKPGNILTTREGVPKLLDFGIAKVLDPQFAPGSTLTRSELRMLTPDYASPEQVRGTQISTASDTYSLGAVLYELLSGARPHRFESDSPGDLERAICEVDPVRLSLAAPKHLRRYISGDLDNIVLTAMRKEPQRRYASAAEFSEDLRRHMEGLPVLARDDRWTYRATKFVGRNRLAVGAALLVAASLLAGIVTTSIQARRAERRFDVARQMARAVVANVTGPMERLPGSTSVRASMIQTVLPYLDKLTEDLGRDPAFELEIADAYRQVANVEGHPFRPNLGRTSDALAHYEKAISIYARLTDRPETRVAALAGVVETNIQAGDVEAREGNLPAAEARLQRVAAIATEAAARDSSNVLPDTWAYLNFRLSDAEARKGAFDKAVSYSRKAVDICREWANVDHGVNARGTLRGAYTKMGVALTNVGDLRGAHEYFELALRDAAEAVKQPDARVHERTMVSTAHEDLANLLGNPYDLNLGNAADAIPHIRRAVQVAEMLASADPEDLRGRDDLATTLIKQGAILVDTLPTEALRSYRTAEEIAEGLTTSNPSNTRFRQTLGFARMGVGEAQHRLGRHREALQKLTLALEALPAIAEGTTSFVSVLSAKSRIHRDQGDSLLALGDERAALEHYRQAVAASEGLVRRLPTSLHFQLGHALSLEALGQYYAALARRRPELIGEARDWLRKSLEIWQDWTRRGVAQPFAGVGERRVAGLLASAGSP
jgi:tetratricopeptide (TPR) repeat protein